MTAEQINRVNELSRQGLGYKRIAALTGIPANTVKTHCRRHPVGGGKTERADAYCRQCGKPLTRQPKQKPRRFCSDACRMKWWNAHPEQIRRRAWYTFVCPQCGEEFQSYGNAHRKYCSRKCAADARRTGGGKGD